VKTIFINSVPYLLEMLTYKGFSKKPKPYSGKPVHFTYLLKVGPQYSGTKMFLDLVLKELHEHLVIYLSCFARSIAFPELVLPVILQIKRFLENCRPSPYAAKLKRLIDTFQNNSKLITAERNLANFSPKDTLQVSNFMKNKKQPTPLESYRDQFQKQLEEERKLEEAEALLELQNERKEQESDEEHEDTLLASDQGESEEEGEAKGERKGEEKGEEKGDGKVAKEGKDVPSQLQTERLKGERGKEDDGSEKSVKEDRGGKSLLQKKDAKLKRRRSKRKKVAKDKKEREEMGVDEDVGTQDEVKEFKLKDFTD